MKDIKNSKIKCTDLSDTVTSLHANDTGALYRVIIIVRKVWYGILEFNVPLDTV